ncbi:hypothetical protein AFLA70_353g001090 [Aspergillus flavus AF70]|nr:hypothetical protein AFLA70_353g001090 [Aspergillus flavus AF70]
MYVVFSLFYPCCQRVGIHDRFVAGDFDLLDSQWSSRVDRLDSGEILSAPGPPCITLNCKAAKPGRTGYVVASAFRFKFEVDKEYPGQAGKQAWFSLTLEPVIMK